MPYHSIRNPDQLHRLIDAILAVDSDLELEGVLRRIVEAACALTGARYGALGVIADSGSGLAEFIHVGVDEGAVERIGHLPTGEGILGVLILDPRPLRLVELRAHPDAVGFPLGHPPMHTFLGVPLRVKDRVFGNLYLTEKQAGEPFTEADESLVVALATAAGIAVENARLHSRAEELSLVSDRGRIARDLHDTVIQRLFATGLALQSSLPLAHDPELRDRLEEAVGALDDTIRQIRSTIFALEPERDPAKSTRVRVLECCEEAAKTLRFEPEVHFSGPVDTTVGGPVASELIATLKEALANVARHAQASKATVAVGATLQDVRLRVVDDGVGVEPGHHKGKGLPNMAQRAELLGGDFRLAALPQGGTEILWRVPLRS